MLENYQINELLGVKLAHVSVKKCFHLLGETTNCPTAKNRKSRYSFSLFFIFNFEYLLWWNFMIYTKTNVMKWTYITKYKMMYLSFKRSWWNLSNYMCIFFNWHKVSDERVRTIMRILWKLTQVLTQNERTKMAAEGTPLVIMWFWRKFILRKDHFTDGFCFDRNNYFNIIGSYSDGMCSAVA